MGRMTVRVSAVSFLAAMCLAVACTREAPPAENAAAISRSGGAALPDTDLFVDATDGSGLSLVHFNGMAGQFLFPEVMTPGIALFDFDNDGDLDVFALQGK